MPEGFVAAWQLSFCLVCAPHPVPGMESSFGDMGNLNDRDVERQAAMRLRQRVAEYFDTRIDLFNTEWHVSDARDELRRQKGLEKNENNPDFVNLDLNEPSPLYILRNYGDLVMKKDREYSEKIEIDVAAEYFNVIIDRYDVPLEVTYQQLYGSLPPRGTVPWGAATLNQTFTPQGQTTNTKDGQLPGEAITFGGCPPPPTLPVRAAMTAAPLAKRKRPTPCRLHRRLRRLLRLQPPCQALPRFPSLQWHPTLFPSKIKSAPNRPTWSKATLAPTATTLSSPTSTLRNGAR